MPAPKVTIVDFETEAIRSRPRYPPKPVGCALRYPGRRSKYLAWGHPTRNNCTLEQATRELRDVWRGGDLCFQAAKFDVDVGEVHLGLKPPSWDRIHDTKYLIFFKDPYAPSLGLKESAERLLGQKPTERDRLREWVLAHVPEARKKPTEWGAYICRAPGDLAGEYACGDVDRTGDLLTYLWNEVVVGWDMREAYDRERRLMPILLENEREGVRVDLPRMKKDLVVFQAAMEKADAWLRRRLGLSKDANIDSDQLMARAFVDARVVTGLKYTAPSKKFPHGQPSVSGKNLTPDMFLDPQVCSAYAYRNKLSTCLGTFLEPWIALAEENDSRIHTSWNQVRASEGGGTAAEGARSGRMSNQPSLSNVPVDWSKAKGEGYVHPAFLRVPELPLMRIYFLPDPGQAWGKRDYNGQELRILAHYEDGPLLARYLEDPHVDIHQEVREGFIQYANVDRPRKSVKNANFADIYGQGIGLQAATLGISVAQMHLLRKIKDTHLMPGVASLRKELMRLWRTGCAIRTLGGREYYCEPAKFIKKKNRVVSFEYKALNYLIQPSGADMIKQSIINYHEHPKREARWLLSVHDENDASMPKSKTGQREQMVVLADAMENAFHLDLEVLSDGELGPNWAELKEFNDEA